MLFQDVVIFLPISNFLNARRLCIFATPTLNMLLLKLWLVAARILLEMSDNIPLEHALGMLVPCICSLIGRKVYVIVIQ